MSLDAALGKVPAHVVTALSVIDVGRGSEALFQNQLPALLRQLADCARVASITASSAIEGVVVSDAHRASRILHGRPTVLRTRSEQEFAGYRDAQDYLFRHEWRPLNVGLLLHLHRLLFAHTPAPGGRFKSQDNLVVDRSPGGGIVVRFRPVAAEQTEFFVSELISRYLEAAKAGHHHQVLLIGLFALDLLVIHPFEDGNGRVTRALTSALLADQEYTVARYVSVEDIIANSADTYYQVLLDSTHGWHDGGADPWPWLGYFVDVLAQAYRVFAQRAASDRTGESKQDRVRNHVLHHGPDIFRLADVRTALPGVSDQTIRLVLDRLRREGRVDIAGMGRTAAWRRRATTR